MFDGLSAVISRGLLVGLNIMISVLILHAQQEYESTLGLKLNELSDLLVVGESSDATNAIKMAKFMAPNVVMINADLSDSGQCMFILKAMLVYNLTSKIIVISTSADADFIQRCFANGAKGFLLEKNIKKYAVQCTKNVCNNEKFIDPSLELRLPLLVKNEFAKLNDTQFNIACFICAAFSSDEIADILNISKNTVLKEHSRILNILKVNNDVQLVKKAIASGLVDIEITQPNETVFARLKKIRKNITKENQK